MDQNRPAAEELFRTSADQFLARENYPAAVSSLLNLTIFLGWQVRGDEVAPLLEEAARAAELSGDPHQQGLVAVQQARHALAQGGDLEAVERDLRARYDRIDETTRYVLHRRILFTLGEVLYELGRVAEARRFDEETIALAEANRDGYNEAGARFNLALRVSARDVYGEGTLRAIDLFRRALETAVAAGNRFVEVDARLHLGRLLGGSEGREELERALEQAADLGSSWLLSRGEAALAVLLAEDSPLESRRLREQATARMVEARNDRWIVYDWTARSAAIGKIEPKERAVADSLAVLEHIEALRSQQHLSQGRADFFSAWTEAFYELSGRLLQEYSETGDPDDLDLAFEVAERLRARLLRDALGIGGAFVEPEPDDPLALERTRILDEIVRVNRGLLRRSDSPTDRDPLLDELASLERDLAGLEDEIAGDAGSWPSRRGFVSLAELRQQLDDSTALLTFQLAPWRNIYGDFAGGSWLTVTTAGESRAYSLPDRTTVEAKLETFLGIFERRDVAEEIAAATLYGDLLHSAVAELPPSIRHLVIVPDGKLHLLPFAILRPAPGEPVLAESYALSEVPSASLWSDWLDEPIGRPTGTALVLADPSITDRTDSELAERGWDRSALGPLPYARREGRAVLRRMGSGSRLLLGAEASEAALKEVDLGPFQIVHFAAHAIADTAHPSRSGVVLSPGSEREDGLLQSREIGELDLRSRIVVLAACDSARGRLLSGEGALSLARPFLRARAAAVVATLWRIEDAAASALFDRFYRHLARGRTVAGALRAAQRDRLRAGAPASEWAGVVVLGRGAVVAVPHAQRPRWRVPRVAAAAALALAVFLLLAVLVRRARR